MKTTITTIERRYSDTCFREGDVVLDITASGRFARTSLLKRTDLIFYKDEKTAQLHTQEAEKEADEYDMLEALITLLAPAKRIITYNGHAFDLPHLRKKYSLYGLADPFVSKDYLDLFMALKPYVPMLALPSRKLRDAAAFLSLGASLCDAAVTMELTSLLSYAGVLQGECSIADVRADGERLIYKLLSPHCFPKELSAHDACFHLRFCADRTVLISARIEDGTLRFYHTDIANYEYLPAEGFAVHKSAAMFVDKSRREKAARETCFHRVKYTEAFLTDAKTQEAYLSSVLAYLRTM